MLTWLDALRRDEDGAIFVLFAAFTGAMVIIFGLVLNVGNLFEHRRHLRIQVDAGALAAARDFNRCFTAETSSAETAANNAIVTAVRRYAGDPDPSLPGGSFNQQFERPDSVKLALNGNAYPAPDGPAYTGPPAGQMPCALRSLDIKARQADVPLLLQAATAGRIHIRAKAKVEVRKLEQLTGMLPWSVPEFDPQTVAAIVVNEQTGSVISTHRLVKGTTTTLNREAVTLWEADARFTVASRTGIVVVASPRANLPLNGSLSAICGQSRTTCYAGQTSTSGLGFIRGFPANIPPGTQQNPQLRDVQLLSPGCTADGSDPYFIHSANCTVTMRARVDFGTGNNDPTDAPERARVELDGQQMTWSNGWFQRNVTIPMGSGRIGPWTLAWQTGQGNNRENGTFTDAAHPYSSNPASGPIKYFTFRTSGASDHTFTVNSRPLVHIAVGVEPSLQKSRPGDRAIVIDLTEARSQAIDCDRGTSFVNEIDNGCQTPYRLNRRDGSCSGFTTGNLPPNTITPNPAPDCVVLENFSSGDLRTGLDRRFETPCSPNNWPSGATSNPLPGPEDPRWVVLAVTDPPAPGQLHNRRVTPVLKLAGFYVTGWDADNCSGNAAYPGTGTETGKVWGHFVPTASAVPGGVESTELCNFRDLSVCLTVLTD